MAPLIPKSVDEVVANRVLVQAVRKFLSPSIAARFYENSNSKISKEREIHEDLVREFYANAIPRKANDSERKSWVRGKIVKYDALTINQFLETNFTDPTLQECKYFDLRGTSLGFSPTIVKDELCVSGKSFILY
ncbi:hypothetical protein VNO78_27409 [Psophocarpus tetragonolobus]|uniref:Putative plant transposon protein domain-containing protein n=1 Tax=Psophocarpus tetragonolobus TaxID=3891 RepID=A0AAN9XAJ3_PSOTE